MTSSFGHRLRPPQASPHSPTPPTPPPPYSRPPPPPRCFPHPPPAPPPPGTLTVRQWGLLDLYPLSPLPPSAAPPSVRLLHTILSAPRPPPLTPEPLMPPEHWDPNQVMPPFSTFPCPPPRLFPLTLLPLSGIQQSRGGVVTPPSDPAVSRHVSVRGSVGGGVFKAPMPPQQQLQVELFGLSGGGPRRDVSRPADVTFGLAPPQDVPSSPLSGLGSPQRSPYAQRLDPSQQLSDPFQSPLTSRPSPDPYTNPQTPGTPRPHSDPTYLSTPPSLRLDHFTQQSAARWPSPSHQTFDPYGSNPGTPRPTVAERFPRSPGSQPSPLGPGLSETGAFVPSQHQVRGGPLQQSY